jgi:hypothetical protein
MATDARLLPLGSPVPPIPAQVGAADRVTSGTAGEVLSFPGAVFLNAAGGTVDGEALVLQSSETEPAWAMYKADGLAGLKISTFGVETVPGSLDAEYSVGISNFSDGRWDYFINTVLPEVAIDLSDNTKRLVSHLGNLYWVVVVSGGKSVRVVAGHVFTAAEQDGDWCPEQVTGLSVSRGLDDRIHIEWNRRDCARKYELWGRLSPDQSVRGASCWAWGRGTEWVRLTTTEDNSFDDYDTESSLWYDYKVRAKNHCGWGGFSAAESGYKGAAPGSGDQLGDTCDAEGVVASLDEAALVLEDGTGYALTAGTQWLLADGSAGGPADFSAGDRVAVDGMAGNNNTCVALSVTMLEKGGEAMLFDAESIITVRDAGLLQLQNGMSFAYDDATAWLDTDGNPTDIANFVSDTGVHVWGSVQGFGQAQALKVQLLPPDPAG